MPPHPVELLVEKLRSLPPAQDVVPVEVRRDYFGFFPGGTGLEQLAAEGTDFRPGGVMVLGHNLYSEEGMKKQRAGATPRSDWEYQTGRTLKNLLPAAGIPLSVCFFTNFFMGLIKGSANTGPFPGARDEAFVIWCQDFLKYQIEVIRPRVLLVLGGHVPPFLAGLAPQLAGWKRWKGFADLDKGELGFLDEVEIAGVTLTIVALTHPSMRRSNVKRRKFGGATGEAAEMMMLQLARARLSF